MFRFTCNTFFTLTVVLTLTTAPSANAQNLLSNGSFEAPLIAPNSALRTTPTAWQGDGSYLYIINGQYGGPTTNYPLPQTGQQYIGLGNQSSITQSVAVDRTSSYSLSWFDSTAYDGPGSLSPYTVQVSNSAGQSVLNEHLSITPTRINEWNQRLYNFTLVPDTYTVRFVGQIPVFGSISMIDTVRLTAVPAPSALAALLIGAVPGAALLLRRKRMRL